MTTDKHSRLRWRCRRGLLELDFILQEFIEHQYANLGEEEQRLFERLLDLPDNMLLAIIQRRQQAPDSELKYIVEKIRDYPLGVCMEVE